MFRKYGSGSYGSSLYGGIIYTGIYSVNGTSLPDNPVIYTMPRIQGGKILDNTCFTLLFANPSSTTQTLLSNGTTVTMIFLASDGSTQSGNVLLQSILSGSMFLVFCTILTTIQINTWVVKTQFL